MLPSGTARYFTRLVGVHPVHNTDFSPSFARDPQTPDIANVRFGEPRRVVLFALHSGAVLNHIGRVFNRGRPAKVPRIDAAFAALTTTMRGLVPRRRRRPIFQNAHVPSCMHRHPVGSGYSTISFGTAERPYEALILKVIDVIGGPASGLACTSMATERIAVFLKVVVVHVAETARSAFLAAARYRAYTFWVSHLDLLGKVGLVRARCSASTLSGFAHSNTALHAVKPEPRDPWAVLAEVEEWEKDAP